MGLKTSGRFTTLGGGVPILSSTGEILGAIGCSTGTSMQDEAAAKAGRDAVLELIAKENKEAEQRINDERAAVLKLWKEKEEEVGNLRGELEGMERGSKRMRLDGSRSETGSISGSVLGRRGSVIGRFMAGSTPDTPPDDVEIMPSFVGEVAVGRY